MKAAMQAQTYQPTRARKSFTLARARRALPLVANIVQDVVAEYAALLEVQEMLERLQRHGGLQQLQPLQEQMSLIAARLKKHVDDLDLVGAELRDYRQGVVDFPAVKDGQKVYLSWQLGQSDIGFWYDPTCPATARQPIGDLGPQAVQVAARRH